MPTGGQPRPGHGFAAAIFDVDGVLVASPHERAWQEALEELMAEWGPAERAAYAPGRFTTAVYQELVAGKARLAGARAVLDYFAVPDAPRRAVEYAARKQRRIEELIDAGAFVAFGDGIRLVQALRARRILVAAASSSKNANRFMAGIVLDGDGTLLEVFDANVCGRDLPLGKPHPGIFLLAARELGVDPAACVVIEDAPSGIQAAKAGGMAAVGVARLHDEALLDAAAADLVVTTLDDVAVDALASGRLVRGTNAGEEAGE